MHCLGVLGRFADSQKWTSKIWRLKNCVLILQIYLQSAVRRSSGAGGCASRSGTVCGREEILLTFRGILAVGSVRMRLSMERIDGRIVRIV